MDKSILQADNTTYNGVAVVSAINELTWEKTWHLAIDESYIGPQFDHLGYTAPVYTDLYEYSCGFFRAFEQHTRQYPEYTDAGLIATDAQGSSSSSFLRGDPDVIQLKVGSKLRM